MLLRLPKNAPRMHAIRAVDRYVAQGLDVWVEPENGKGTLLAVFASEDVELDEFPIDGLVSVELAAKGNEYFKGHRDRFVPWEKVFPA